MSPLFHRTGDDTEGEAPSAGHLPSLFELGSRLDEVVQHVAALPVEQLAARPGGAGQRHRRPDPRPGVHATGV